ncbi:MAG TPA: hypothetical protein VE990_05350 [Acidimicrobiales bacterium]|nr:hypothetical protein [Acidimicrobiales bacterium]
MSTTEVPGRHQSPAPGAAAPPPALADGVELIGEYEHSGFKVPPALVRRGDGQVIQLPGILYQVAATVDGRKDYETVASEVSQAVGRQLTADNVEFLVSEKLAPIGVTCFPDGGQAAPAKPDPFLGLKFRAALIPESVTGALGRMLKVLFPRPIVLAVLAALGLFDYWLFAVHGVAQPLRQSLVHPAAILVLLALVVGSAGFHETGHAAGCVYGGASPGRMGCGLYLAWPAFYTDVTDSYRLDRAGRLRTDLGGVYFNAVFVLFLAGLYFVTRFEPLLLAVVVTHIEIAHQLIPVVRLDGYYIVSDLTGVPDLFARIGPILRSWLPGRPADERVAVLKPWVRRAVTVWILVVVPVLAIELAMVLVNLPRIFATAWHSGHGFLHQAVNASGDGRILAASSASAQLLVLALPLAGIVLMLLRGGRSAIRATARATEGRPGPRAAAVLGGVLVVGGLAYAWIPPGGYRPIQRNERGTLAEGWSSLGSLAHGHGIATPAVMGTGSGATVRGTGGSGATSASTTTTSSPTTSSSTTTTVGAGRSGGSTTSTTLSGAGSYSGSTDSSTTTSTSQDTTTSTTGASSSTTTAP